MHVVFAHIGDVVVDHVRQVVDVDPARSDVGGHQGADGAALEVGQRLGARALALVAVQRQRTDAVGIEVVGHVVGAKLGACKHQHLAPVVFFDDVRQQRFFLAAPDRVDGLHDALHRGVGRRDLNVLRAAQQAVGQFTDLVAEGGRKQQALLVLRQQAQDFFHVVNETHVEHAVGFVEHQNFDLGQI